MSRVEADNFYSAGSASTGALGIPKGSEAEKPVSNLPQAGLRYNETTGGIELYADSAWSSFGSGGADGSNSASAFGYLSEVDGLYTGTQNLWTTAGGQVSPFQISVNFDIVGGPWYEASFSFPDGITSGGMNSDMVHVTNSATNDGFKGAYNENVNVGYGAQNFPSLYGHSVTATQGEGITVTGEVTTGSSGGTTSVRSINYLNHATNSNFSSTQLNALRNIISKLCPATPFVGSDYDSDGNQQTQIGWERPWDRYVESGTGYAHIVYIRDVDGNTQMACVGQSDPSNNGQAYLWTENTFQRVRNYIDGEEAGVGAEPYGLLNSKMILPAQWFGYTGSGGGAAFGAYYNSDIGRKNNKVVFLFK